MSEGYGDHGGRRDPYGSPDAPGAHGRQPTVVGYDEYGQPVYGYQEATGPGDPYAQQPGQPGQPPPGTYGAYGAYETPDANGAFDGGGRAAPRYEEAPYGTGAYGTGAGGAGGYAGDAYGSDPYGAGASPYAQPQQYATYEQHEHDPYRQPQQPQQPQQPAQPQQMQQARQPEQSQQAQQTRDWIPRQGTAPEQEGFEAHGQRQQPAGGPGAGQQSAPGGEGEEYRPEEFAFVDEPSDNSEDVIDWLKFTESRTERREEAKRRGRNRKVALVVVLALVLVSGAGYLWYAGKLPGTAGPGAGAGPAAGQQRNVIVVHLRSTSGGGSTSALLVDNADAKRGDTVLLPNSLAVSADDGTTTTLGKSVEHEGASPTRDSLSTLLGADIKGTWRLDTPYLENLVDLVGGVTVDANATVPGAKKGAKPVVNRGRSQELGGPEAVAYATYRAPGEPQTRQLERFGQVMQQTLRKVSSSPSAATDTVEKLGQIPDPSLSESQLGTSLAKLAGRAKAGEYRTQLLPVRSNGTLGRSTDEGLVKKVLGGAVKNSDPHAAPRVKVTNAGGDRGADDAASAALVNGGYTVVNGGSSSAARARTLVTYASSAQREKAVEVAKTLGLRGSAVRKGASIGNADVAVVLGRDYKG